MNQSSTWNPNAPTASTPYPTQTYPSWVPQQTQPTIEERLSKIERDLQEIKSLLHRIEWRV